MESSEKSMPRCEKQNSDAKSHLNPNYSEEMIYTLHHPTTIRDLDDKNIKNPTRQEKEMRRLDDEKIEKLLKNCTILQHRFILNKLKLQCHYKQRMQKAEIRRKKIINRLKYFYEIDVELLKNSVADEVIVGIQKIEKERRIKEKRKAEGMMVMISRLLEEQRRKREVVRKRPDLKKSKPVIGRTDIYFEMPDESIWTGDFDEEESNISVDEQSAENLPVIEESLKKIVKQDEVTSKQEDEKMKKKSGVISAPLCPSATRQKVLGENLMATSFITDLNEASNLAQKKAKMISDLATAEKFLKATPETIIFKNFECEKSYDQELKITNIGTSSLQCRFLEVEFDEVYEDLCPLKVPKIIKAADEFWHIKKEAARFTDG